MFCEDEAPCESWEGLGVWGRPRVRWEGGGLCAPLRRSPPFLPAVAGALPPQLIGFSEFGPPAMVPLGQFCFCGCLGSPIFERGFEGALRVLAVFSDLQEGATLAQDAQTKYNSVSVLDKYTRLSLVCADTCSKTNGRDGS